VPNVTHQIVIAGLAIATAIADQAIHHMDRFIVGWMRGSSPRMANQTTRYGGLRA